MLEGSTPNSKASRKVQIFGRPFLSFLLSHMALNDFKKLIATQVWLPKFILLENLNAPAYEK